METILVMVLSSLFALIIVNDFEPTIFFKNKLKKCLKVKTHWIIDIPIQIIYKLLSCSSCFSYWLFSFTYLFIYGSGYGFLLGVIVYYLSYILNKIIYTTKL